MVTKGIGLQGSAGLGIHPDAPNDVAALEFCKVLEGDAALDPDGDLLDCVFVVPQGLHLAGVDYVARAHNLRLTPRHERPQRHPAASDLGRHSALHRKLEYLLDVGLADRDGGEDVGEERDSRLGHFVDEVVDDVVRDNLNLLLPGLLEHRARRVLEVEGVDHRARRDR
eukprot:CAMPEP_0180134724 /NCGR_PEP_ID=MMETSP0986-20121125/10342_1 /TAXON_ID=697907 /ORGANISM="non described non described, Strain CCMP2293" /LENGTH=168 /DNA_ID=CAMNT_0022075159 /DNA_START=400 /DNA_END=906 /DNA_ORIENTATION=+